MKRTLIRPVTLLLALMTVLSLAGCAPNADPPETEYTPDHTVLEGKTDLMAIALEQAGYDRFGSFPSRSRGAGTFRDYTLLHIDPLDIGHDHILRVLFISINSGKTHNLAPFSRS